MKARNTTPKKMLLAGRIIGVLVVLFLLFDAVSKVLKLGPAVEGTIALGYPESAVFGIGLALLVCARSSARSRATPSSARSC